MVSISRRGGVHAAALLLGCSVVATPEPTMAHGAFPRPLGTLLDAQGEDPWVVASFGMLLPDVEPGFQWICEEVAGGELRVAVTWLRTPANTLIASSREGIFRFEPGLCTARRPLGDAGTGRVLMLANHPSRPVVMASLADGTAHVSHDDGRTFAPLTADTRGGRLASVLLDDDAEGNLRATGLWQFNATGEVELQQGPLSGGSGPRIGAVGYAWQLVAHDRARPGHVYVREDGPEVDRILRVRVADAVVTDVLMEATDELAVAVSPGAQFVAVGGLRTRLHVSPDAGDTLLKRADPTQVLGLTITDSGTVYVAAHNWLDGFAVGRSDDLGLTFTGLGQFVDIRGVQVCADAGPGCDPVSGPTCSPHGNDVAATCDAFWPALRERFGIPGPDAGHAVEADAGTLPPQPGPGPACSCTSDGSPVDGACATLLAWLLAGRRRR